MSKRDKAFSKAFGARMAKRRLELGLTQAEVGEALGVAQQTCGHYEVGRHDVPISSLPDLLQVLAVDAEYLLGISSKPRSRGRTSLTRSRRKRARACRKLARILYRG